MSQVQHGRFTPPSMPEGLLLPYKNARTYHHCVSQVTINSRLLAGAIATQHKTPIDMGVNRSVVPNEVENYLESISKGCPRRLDHTLHPQHPLIKTLRPGYLCDTCGLPSSDVLGNGWSYYCAICDFDLHPKCALECSDPPADDTRSLLSHNLHKDHLLAKIPQEGSFWCEACSEKGHSWSYSCEQCDFHLHVSCAEEAQFAGGDHDDPPERMVFEIVRTCRGSYWCNRCAEEGKGWSYHREDCGLDVHPRCATNMQHGGSSWPTGVAHQLHREHQLVRSRREAYLCHKCRAQGRGWSFRCDACDFDLHPKCAVDDNLEAEDLKRKPCSQQQQQQSLNGNAAGGAQADPQMTALEQQRKMLEDFDKQQAEMITINAQMQAMMMMHNTTNNIINSYNRPPFWW